MFVTAVWPANLSYLFTFGSFKIEMFLVSVLKTAPPVEYASALFNLYHSLLFSVILCDLLPWKGITCRSSSLLVLPESSSARPPRPLSCRVYSLRGGGLDSRTWLCLFDTARVQLWKATWTLAGLCMGCHGYPRSCKVNIHIILV